MSRHRNVRSMNYSDEYDGYDDVYGHSVEEDYCVSPSSAAFMYDRSRPAQMSMFLNSEPDIAEEEDSPVAVEDVRADDKPSLNDIEEAKLRSCLDEVRSVVGDSIPDDQLIEAVVKSGFDLEKSLDQVLNSTDRATLDMTASKKPSTGEESPKPQRLSSRRHTPEVCKLVEKSPIITVAAVTPGKRIEGFDVPSRTPDGNVTPRDQSPRLLRKTPEPDTVKKMKEDSAPVRKKNAEKVVEEYTKDRGGVKAMIHMVVVGHVDAGKSTLMGHILLKMGHVSSKTMHKYEQESKKLGKQSFVYAWILDETGEERSRGITMDVGQSKFETAHKVVCVLDAPGHKDFIPNMITGASQADVALLVVDSTRGEFETGFELGGQTREHALLVRSLGVNQLCVVVNKLDTVAWNKERFLEIVSKMKTFLRQAGYKEKDLQFIPCSGLSGINLTEPPPAELALSTWYNGPTLVQAIDEFAVPERPITKPLRLSVNDVFKGTGTGFCISGRIETGSVQQGDKVLVLPQNETATVKGITIDDVIWNTAYAGDYASVTLLNYDQQNISVGSILCSPSAPSPVTDKFEARIVIFNTVLPITKGFPVVIHMQFLSEQATITKLISELHKSTGEEIRKRPRCLLKNSSAMVQVTVSKPIAVELYRDIKELGRFMLRVGGITIAAGLVTKIL